MEQTPVHEVHNPDLLRIIPAASRRLIEIGCSSGALAREFRKINPDCHYVGVEIDPSYAALANRHCDATLTLDLDQADSAFWGQYADRDCWIFGDTLEHLRDPWKVLRNIRAILPAGGSIAMCVPNAQHWSVQARLLKGEFRYEDSGLLDRTHLRWFTRITLLQSLLECGLVMKTGFPRIFPEPGREPVLAGIESFARAIGMDPEIAVRDALPIQYVILAQAQ